jgi:anti-sigma regulatory factor (Ser/Thr protein kinase)
LVVVVEDELRLRLEAEARRLADVRRAIRAWLDSQRIDRPEDVVLAVDEAVANAIEHSRQRQQEPAFIDVVAKLEQNAIRVDVIDDGSWRPRRDDDTRGRGLNIINALMDDVQVASTSSGTCVTMYRRVHR